MAERALAAGFGGTERNGETDAPISGTRAERYQVMLHVDAGHPGGRRGGGQSELERRTRVPAGDVSAHSLRLRAGHDRPRTGRPGRSAPAAEPAPCRPSVRRALEARDRGCRFPGCGSRFTDAHHVKHWADGGETSLRNLVLLCKRHHRAVHEGGVQVCLDVKGQVVFFTPRGKALMGAPPRRFDREMDLAVGQARQPSEPPDISTRPPPAPPAGNATATSPGRSRPGPGRRSIRGEGSGDRWQPSPPVAKPSSQTPDLSVAFNPSAKGRADDSQSTQAGAAPRGPGRGSSGTSPSTDSGRAPRSGPKR